MLPLLLLWFLYLEKSSFSYFVPQALVHFSNSDTDAQFTFLRPKANGTFPKGNLFTPQKKLTPFLHSPVIWLSLHLFVFHFLKLYIKF